MPTFWVKLTSTLGIYRYPLAAFGAFAEGPIIMVAGGFLLRLGEFSFLPLFSSLVLGDMLADAVWYWVGRNAAEPFLRRFGHIFGVTSEVFKKMERIFHRHDAKIIFISKITMGFGFALATLIAAGAVRISFKKYLLLNFLGDLIWVGFLLSLGYFFGNLYTLVDAGFRFAFVFTLVVCAIAASIGFTSFLRAKFGDASKT